MATYDTIVIGGGHAGCEAAWAAARMGCRTALVTMRIDAIARMSCNPAIGGLGKGQMVREIDALGGLMGLAIDRAGIQFRTLNRSKGPAVQAPRAQADRALYTQAVIELLRSVPGLEVIEGTVEGILVGAGDEGRGLLRNGDAASFPEARVRAEKGDAALFSEAKRGPAPCAAQRPEGCCAEKVPVPFFLQLADGRELHAKTVVATTGTFLRGLMHCGPVLTEGGRVGEPAAVGLSESLEKLGFTLGRLKTGTPPRVHRDSVDFDRMTPQPGDESPEPFSFMSGRMTRRQVPCWITHTNEQTHRIIRENIHRAPMYSGQIKSRGPRYCPSIEDKVMRFADKPSHQVFLEPEGYDSPWMYCNGIPTSLPKDVQEAMVHSIQGLERAEIVQYGYAVEYDWVPTDQITSTLETRRVAGLFLAGQVNGTSGYEEAGGQGLIAGMNAAARVLGREPVILGRDEAYIGVMIDDLVTRPPDEPYRMFTSRAEYRLHLRSDNADARLTPIGRRMGLVDDARWGAFSVKQAAIESLESALRSNRTGGQSLLDLLRRPEIRLADLCRSHIELTDDMSPVILEAVEIQAKYAGYLEREQRQIERYRHLEARAIPESFDFTAVAELRYEAREKFTRFRPRSLGQAARISGISPADIATLSLYVVHQQGGKL
ncbi:MAG: tRNA uridine-5-carboxymethylaminomethyl(34) synthesis enzyme MnmG [Phycisphaerae bacterium]|nr:tRNA uridine-5-carboxymethylaminomethyl(34) synthesis enzyme MnmG [Phycisphaerae bacterium]